MNSPYLRDLVMQALPPGLYVSLHSGDPSATGTAELTGQGYARQAIILQRMAAGAANNGNTMEYPALPAAEVKYFGLWDAERGGHFLLGASLALPITILDGQTIRWRRGELNLHIT